MNAPLPDHYATLGLDRSCTDEQIRSAYRLLAKQFHPDLNHGSPHAIAKTQALNAAYEILSDSNQRKCYDSQLEAREKQNIPRGKSQKPISQDVSLKIEDCFRGARLSVCVNDPTNPGSPENYELTVPKDTAPGAKFTILRVNNSNGGVLNIRIKIRPDFRYKIRGSDLRCDLRISPQRAAQGGTEFIDAPNGSRIRVQIPRGTARNEMIRIKEEGLPKPRGGRGDLVVRLVYRPEVKFKRMK